MYMLHMQHSKLTAWWHDMFGALHGQTKNHALAVQTLAMKSYQCSLDDQAGSFGANTL